MTEQEFDSYFKKLADCQAEDEIPDWGLIEGRLERSRRRNIFIRWASVTVSAAAAALAAVLMLRSGGSGITVVQAPEAPLAAFYGITLPDDVPETVPVADLGRDMLRAAMMDMPQAASAAAPTQEPGAQESATQDDAGNGAAGRGQTYKEREYLDGLSLSDAWEDTQESRDRQDGGSGISLSFGGTAEASTFGNLIITPAKRRMMQAQSAFPVDPNLNARDTVIEKKSGSFSIPVSVGVSARIPLAGRFGMTAGINYTVMSRSLAGEYNGEYYTDIRNTQQFVGIPVNFYYDIVSNEHVNVYVQAGGAVERSVSDAYRMNDAFGNTISHYEPAKGLQLSVSAGIGIEYWFSRFAGLYFDPSLRYYFDNRQSKSIRTDQQFQSGFELGVRFRF